MNSNADIVQEPKTGIGSPIVWWKMIEKITADNPGSVENVLAMPDEAHSHLRNVYAQIDTWILFSIKQYCVSKCIFRLLRWFFKIFPFYRCIAAAACRYNIILHSYIKRLYLRLQQFYRWPSRSGVFKFTFKVTPSSRPIRVHPATPTTDDGHPIEIANSRTTCMRTYYYWHIWSQFICI